MIYATSTPLAAIAADPPLIIELPLNKYCTVKKVIKGKKTIAAVKRRSFLTTELFVSGMKKKL